MENLKKLLDEMQAAQDAKVLTVDQRVAELAEIENNIKQLSVLLHTLFNRKHELETAEEEYQKELALLEEKFAVLEDIYAPKK